MQQLKFRGWDKEHKFMFEVREITFENNKVLAWRKALPEEFSPEIGRLVGTEAELMQYTGVKDESGNESCSGDVLELYLNDYGDIENPEKFIVNCDKRFFSDVCYLQQIEAHINQSDTNDYIKIVGNIYDNPELVTP